MFDFLQPISEEFLQYVKTLPSHTIGQNTSFYTAEAFPDLKRGSVVLFSVNEYRNSIAEANVKSNFDAIRKHFYKLAKGDWLLDLIDLGQINSGAEVNDTYFAVTRLVQEIHKSDCIPVIVGGSQDITYANYRAYDPDKGMVNLVSIDACFDLGNVDLPITNESYVGKIVVDRPYNLFNYTNLGYQTYYAAPEELDLIERMFFDLYRLGEISKDLAMSEPIIRDADIVSVDLNVLEATFYGENPNGFSGKELCALARYSGISDKVSSFGIYEYKHEKCTKASNQLVAQLIWYFIEGVNCRWGEIGELSTMDVTHYHVPVDDQILSFYRSNITARWWMEITPFATLDNILTSNTLLPCTYADYENACNQNIPERWFNAKMKYEM